MLCYGPKHAGMGNSSWSIIPVYCVALLIAAWCTVLLTHARLNMSCFALAQSYCTACVTCVHSMQACMPVCVLCHIILRL